MVDVQGLTELIVASKDAYEVPAISEDDEDFL